MNDFQRELLISWTFRFGFALAGLLTVYLLFFAN